VWPSEELDNKVALKKTSSVSARTILTVYVPCVYSVDMFCTEVAIVSNGRPRQAYLGASLARPTLTLFKCMLRAASYRGSISEFLLQL